MKLLSDAGEYALRAMVWLAGHPDEPQTTDQITQGTMSTHGYLVRVLQSLSRAGLVQSKRGVGGGHVLGKPATEVTVLDVLNAVDPMQRIHTCPLGLKQHAEGLCALHRRVDEAAAYVEHLFSDVTIADILSDRPGVPVLCSRVDVSKSAKNAP